MTDPTLAGYYLALYSSRPGGDIVLLRGRRMADGAPVLVRTHRAVPPDPAVRDRLRRQHVAHRSAAAAGADRMVAPVADLVDEPQRVALVLHDPGGHVLDVGQHRDPAIALDLADGLAQALRAVHESGWWHLDLRDEDVLLTAGGPVLIGLGTATAAQPATAAQLPAAVGPHHAARAPECGWLQRLVDGRADQYGLGVLLYRCLAGRDPLPLTDSEELGAAQLGRRPASLTSVREDLAPVVADVVDKLLSPDPDGRYRGWPGLLADLTACRKQLLGGEAVAGIGLADAPVAFSIPDGLFGRDSERQALADAWGHASAAGRSHLVLLTGESGAGKSALASDALDALGSEGVVCGQSDFDLLGADAPLATFAGALDQVVSRPLGEPDERLAPVVAAVRAQLGTGISTAVGLVAALGDLVGADPAAVEGGAPDGRPKAGTSVDGAVGAMIDDPPGSDPTVHGIRPHPADRALIDLRAALGTAGVPLAIVLDDLPRADPATLHLLGQVLLEAAVGPLLVIGTCRSEDVVPGHPLVVARAGWEEDGADIAEIVVGPLDDSAVAEMLAHAVGLQPTDTATLAATVVERTGGNALFTRIYLAELAQWDLIGFDGARGRWAWDLQEIAHQNMAESAPELVLGRIERAGPDVQQLLQPAAHLDRALPLPVLADLLGVSPARAEDLAEQARAEGLLRLDRDDRFRFAHDRVRQAVLDALDPAERDRLHVRIGRHLRAQLAIGDAPSDDIDVFAVVAQLNRARHLITDPAERDDLRQLDQQGALLARRRGAYATALELQRAAIELLPDAGERPDATGEVRGLRYQLLVQAADNALLAGRPEHIEECARRR